MREKKREVKSMTNFYGEVLELAQSYSDKYLEGTKRAMAMLRLLGFKRRQFRVRTPQDRKRKGWHETKVHFVSCSPENQIISKKVIESRQLIQSCEFDINFYVFDNPKLNFICMEENVRPGTFEVIFVKDGKLKRKSRPWLGQSLK